MYSTASDSAWLSSDTDGADDDEECSWSADHGFATDTTTGTPQWRLYTDRPAPVKYTEVPAVAASTNQRVPRVANRLESAHAGLDANAKPNSLLGSYDWHAIHELLLGRGPLFQYAQPLRPPKTSRSTTRHVFLERPKARRERSKSHDKWLNSGGNAGGMVYWINESSGIRKRYMRIVPQDGADPMVGAEYFHVTGSRADPHEDLLQDMSSVAFVVDNRRATSKNYKKNSDDTVLALKAKPHQSRFISFQLPKTSRSGGDNDQTFELGAIVKHGQGVKLQSRQGDFAEWHRVRNGERPFDEGDVVGFDDRGQIMRRTQGACMLGVISRKAVVEGSAPPLAERDRWDTVAYTGIVPVKIVRRKLGGCESLDQTGPSAGDIIQPSGRNDGTAVVTPVSSATAESPRVGVVLESFEWGHHIGDGNQLVEAVIVSPTETVRVHHTKTLRKAFWFCVGVLIAVASFGALLLHNDSQPSSWLHNVGEPSSRPVIVRVSRQCRAALADAVHCHGFGHTTKHEHCGIYDKLVDLVKDDSALNSRSWLHGSPGVDVLNVLRMACANGAGVLVTDNCSTAMVRQECVQRYVPIAVEIGVCAAASRSRGLSLGGNDYAFVGNYTSSVGCYTYSSGSYTGMAFYSLWEGAPENTKSIVQLQPWQQIYAQPRLPQVNALRVHGTDHRSTQSISLSGDYIRMPIRCGGHPVYQLGGSGGKYAIFVPAHAVFYDHGTFWASDDMSNAVQPEHFWVLADTQLMQHCQSDVSAGHTISQLDIHRDSATSIAGHDDQPISVVFTSLLGSSTVARDERNTSFITEIPCNQGDPCCGLLAGGLGQCAMSVCTFCRSNGQCDSCLGRSILFHNGSRLELGGHAELAT